MFILTSPPFCSAACCIHKKWWNNVGPAGKNPALKSLVHWTLRRFFLNEQLVKCFLIFILIGYNSLYYPLIGPYLQSAGLVAPSYCSIEKPDMAWARGTWCGVRPWREKQRVNARCQGHRPPLGCLPAIQRGWMLNFCTIPDWEQNRALYMRLS